MGLPARFDIIKETEQYVVIQDLGPWDVCFTVTNDAEGVVQRLVSHLAGRRLFYVDSNGDTDELLVRDGEFAGFRPGPRSGL
jgi:hypothetical protein